MITDEQICEQAKHVENSLKLAHEARRELAIRELILERAQSQLNELQSQQLKEERERLGLRTDLEKGI